MAKTLQQSQTAHPLPFLLVSSSDGSTPVYGASPTVGISKNGGAFIAPAGAVSENSIAAPSAPTVSNAASGGTVLANTYYAVITYLNVLGETIGSSQSSTTTTGSISTLTINSPAAETGAVNWKAYVGTASGGPYYLQGSANAIGTNLTLTAPPSTTSATAPTQNSTSGGWYSLSGNATDSNTLGPLILKATAAGAAPTDSEFQVVAYNPDNAVNLGLSSLPNVALPIATLTGSPSTTSFTATGASLDSTASAYAHSYFLFTSGVNASVALPITSYSYATSTGTFGFTTAFPAAPSAGDTGVVVGSHVP